MRISEPVVVAVSKPYETRWGYFQFPAICCLPGGKDEALLVYSNFQHTNTAGQLCKSVEVRRINLAD
jgi:hypothetical protein